MTRIPLRGARVVALFLLAGVSLAVPGKATGEGPPRPAAPPKLAPPVTKGPWIVPAPGKASDPVWGIKGGIVVGLWPTPGPRGLLRVYAPYLGHPPGRVINFIAVEPVVGKDRGLSELEPSALDRADGKAMWTGDAPEKKPKPRRPWEPAAGREVRIGKTKALRFYVFVERFRNGARPVVQVTLRLDRPHEVGLKVFAAKGSAPMRTCILTATMGNYARLRRLWLKDRVVDSRTLWKEPRPDRWGFLPHREWQVGELRAVNGRAVAAATPDEADPARAAYAKGTPFWWHYEGKPATQYWRAPRHRQLLLRVNGRKTYWASDAPIPGGIAFENFELEAPFRAGLEFTFGVTPDRPGKLGFRESRRK